MIIDKFHFQKPYDHKSAQEKAELLPLIHLHRIKAGTRFFTDYLGEAYPPDQKQDRWMLLLEGQAQVLVPEMAELRSITHSTDLHRLVCCAEAEAKRLDLDKQAKVSKRAAFLKQQHASAVGKVMTETRQKRLDLKYFKRLLPEEAPKQDNPLDSLDLPKLLHLTADEGRSLIRQRLGLAEPLKGALSPM